MRYYSEIIKTADLVILLPIIQGKSTFSKIFQLCDDYHHIKTLEEHLVQTVSSKSIVTPALLLNENLISNGRLVEIITQLCKENNVTIKQNESRLLDSEGVYNKYKLYNAKIILTDNYVTW